MLTLILGGARSGKSLLAQRLAMQAGRVIYVATARAESDHEMLARIEHHRAHRSSEWQIIEEPLKLGDVIESAANDADAILVDCLTIWLSNLFWEHRDGTPAEVEGAWRADLQRMALAARRVNVIAVSNEVGCGTVPEAAVTRAFRDAHGFLNQSAAEIADQVILTVAGLPLYLKKVNQEGTSE